MPVAHPIHLCYNAAEHNLSNALWKLNTVEHDYNRMNNDETGEYLAELLECLRNPDREKDTSSWDSVPIPFEITPEEFLRYAETDLEATLPHRFVNALSNTKRALDCQLDSILDALGLYETSRTQRWGFPAKLRILEDIGMVTPRILSKINRMRNLLEHEYQSPSPESVDDALDTASIFVAYTNSLLRRFPRDASVVLASGPSGTLQRAVDLKFSQDDKTLRIQIRTRGAEEPQISLKPDHPLFRPFFKEFINCLQ